MGLGWNVKNAQLLNTRGRYLVFMLKGAFWIFVPALSNLIWLALLAWWRKSSDLILLLDPFKLYLFQKSKGKFASMVKHNIIYMEFGSAFRLKGSSQRRLVLPKSQWTPHLWAPPLTYLVHRRFLVSLTIRGYFCQRHLKCHGCLLSCTGCIQRYKCLWPIQLLTNFCNLALEPNYQYSPSLKSQL